MATRKEERRYGLVISVNCDNPSRTLHPTADRASDLLAGAGLEVRKLYAERAEAACFYATLTELSVAGGRVVAVFVVAHGSELALIGSDRRQMFTKDMGQFLRGAIVVANSCFLSEEFPKGVTGEHAAAATIGYSPKLRVAVDSGKVSSAIRKMFGRPSAVDGMNECVLVPFVKLVLEDLSVGEAVEAAQKAWRVLAAGWDKRDFFLARAMHLNEKAVRCWGDVSRRFEHGLQTSPNS